VAEVPSLHSSGASAREGALAPRPMLGADDKVPIACPSCGTVSRCVFCTGIMRCPACRRRFEFRACRQCDAANVVPRLTGTTGWLCATCRYHNSQGLLGGRVNWTSAQQMHLQQLREGLFGSEEAIVVRGCTLLGGYGIGLAAGTLCDLRYAAGVLSLVHGGARSNVCRSRTSSPSRLTGQARRRPLAASSGVAWGWPAPPRGCSRPVSSTP
jgi:hypothetical protein